MSRSVTDRSLTSIPETAKINQQLQLTSVFTPVAVLVDYLWCRCAYTHVLCTVFLGDCLFVCLFTCQHTDPASAKSYIQQQGAPIVVKTSGLAAGKGVIVAATVDEACKAVDDMMVAGVFGDAGGRSHHASSVGHDMIRVRVMFAKY